MPDVRFHDLRHTCATLLLTKGVHPKIVSEMLGHSSVSITLDIYSHVVPGMRRRWRWRTRWATIPALVARSPSDL